jgi:hypothetical protein
MIIQRYMGTVHIVQTGTYSHVQYSYGLASFPAFT